MWQPFLLGLAGGAGPFFFDEYLTNGSAPAPPSTLDVVRPTKHIQAGPVFLSSSPQAGLLGTHERHEQGRSVHLEQKLRQKLLQEPALGLEVVGLQAPEPPLSLNE